MIIRIYWHVAGEHVHCKVFVAGEPLAQFAKAGDLVLQKQEFVALSAGRFQAEFFEDEQDHNFEEGQRG